MLVFPLSPRHCPGHVQAPAPAHSPAQPPWKPPPRPLTFHANLNSRPRPQRPPRPCPRYSHHHCRCRLDCHCRLALPPSVRCHHSRHPPLRASGRLPLPPPVGVEVLGVYLACCLAVVVVGYLAVAADPDQPPPDNVLGLAVAAKFHCQSLAGVKQGATCHLAAALQVCDELVHPSCHHGPLCDCVGCGLCERLAVSRTGSTIVLARPTS